MYIFHRVSLLKNGEEMLTRIFVVIVIFIHGLGDISHVYYMHGHHICVVLDFNVLGGLLFEGLE
jgi:hypothetical protein